MNNGLLLYIPHVIGFTIINLDCVIGRRAITVQLPPSNLAKLIILMPVFTMCGLGEIVKYYIADAE
jgi:hypothetical protein